MSRTHRWCQASGGFRVTSLSLNVIIHPPLQSFSSLWTYCLWRHIRLNSFERSGSGSGVFRRRPLDPSHSHLLTSHISSLLLEGFPWPTMLSCSTVLGQLTCHIFISSTPSIHQHTRLIESRCELLHPTLRGQRSWPEETAGVMKCSPLCCF